MNSLPMSYCCLSFLRLSVLVTCHSCNICVLVTVISCFLYNVFHHLPMSASSIYHFSYHLISHCHEMSSKVASFPYLFSLYLYDCLDVIYFWRHSLSWWRLDYSALWRYYCTSQFRHIFARRLERSRRVHIVFSWSVLTNDSQSGKYARQVGHRTLFLRPLNILKIQCCNETGNNIL